MKPPDQLATPCRCGWFHRRGAPTSCQFVRPSTKKKSTSTGSQHARLSSKVSYRWSQFKNQARQRNKTVEITFHEYTTLIKSTCAYCGTEPSKSVRIGVDRLNNNRGYVKGNVAPCCAPCNYMKRAMPVSAFLGHVALICSHSTPQEPRT